MSETKLLTCPFCGGEAKIATYDFGYSIKEYWIYCHSCDCASGRYHSKEQAIEAWNTRKPIDDIVERLKELKMTYFLTIANTGNENNDFGYENVGNALDKAIDIVRNAGKEGAE